MLILREVVVDDPSDALDVELGLMFALSIDRNILHIIDNLLGLLNVNVIKRFKELLPPFLHIRHLPHLLLLFKTRSLLDIRIADRIAHVASLLLLHLLLPHQVVNVLLQLRQPVQHDVLELVAIHQLLVFGGEDVAARRGQEVGLFS